MTALIALVTRILSVLTTVLGYTQTILGFTTSAAQEHQPFAIETIASNAANTVNSPTFGNAALLAAIADAKAQGIADTAAILVAILDLTDGTTPVSLPVVPPTGYGGPSSSDNASAVWTEYVLSDLVTPWEYLKSLGSRSLFLKGYAEIYKTDDLFSFFFPAYDQFGSVSGGQPSFDWGVVNPANTFLEELTLQNGAYDTGWYDGVGGMVELHDPIGMSALNFITNITGLEYDVLTGRSSPVSTTMVPPVWPGLALVTMGSPVGIAAQLTVDGPMDGVEIIITAVSSSKPNVPYDTQNAYKFIGAIAFVDDNGDVEPYQQLSFANALYCPKFMTRATSVVVRADASVVGTVTPWVIA